MFISNEEKRQIFTDIEAMKSLINNLTAEVKAMKGKKIRTETQRAKQREYAKRYYNKKRMEKKNAETIAA